MKKNFLTQGKLSISYKLNFVKITAVKSGKFKLLFF